MNHYGKIGRQDLCESPEDGVRSVGKAGTGVYYRAGDETGALDLEEQKER